MITSHLLRRLGTCRPLMAMASCSWLGGAVTQGPRVPAVALTFDDGPDLRWTPRILDALAAAGAKATFFCVGRSAERAPELVRRAAAEGHEIATHLWSHERSTVMDAQVFQDELARSVSLLSGLGGTRVVGLRFPYGEKGHQSPRVLLKQGWQVVSWSFSALDSRDPDPGRIAARVRTCLRPGGIVLLHDGIADLARIAPPYLDTRDATVRALPEILTTIERRGWRAVTVRELLGAPRVP